MSAASVAPVHSNQSGGTQQSSRRRQAERLTPGNRDAQAARPGASGADTGRSRPSGQSQAAGRITIALIPQVQDQLRRLQERTGWSRTDLVNRSITLYEFIDAQLNAGSELMLRDSASGEAQTVHFL